MTMTIARARNLVRQYTGVTNPETIEAIATRMVEKSECVWHALSQVTGKACWCRQCSPNIPAGSFGNI